LERGGRAPPSMCPAFHVVSAVSRTPSYSCHPLHLISSYSFLSDRTFSSLWRRCDSLLPFFSILPPSSFSFLSAGGYSKRPSTDLGRGALPLGSSVAARASFFFCLALLPLFSLLCFYPLPSPTSLLFSSTLPLSVFTPCLHYLLPISSARFPFSAFCFQGYLLLPVICSNGVLFRIAVVIYG